jgi:hypothetical protein
MDSQPSLKLVKDKPLEEVGPYKFNRRSAPRWTCSGRVTAVLYGAEHGRNAEETSDLLPTGGVGRITSLQLLDQSARGAGCWSHDPMPIGSKVVMFFPPHGPEKGFDMTGRVMRCDGSAPEGFHVGIALEVSATAAA